MIFLGRNAIYDPEVIERGVGDLPDGYSVFASRRMQHLTGDFRIVGRNYEEATEPVVGIGYAQGQRVLVLFVGIGPQHRGLVQDVTDRSDMLPLLSLLGGFDTNI